MPTFTKPYSNVVRDFCCLPINRTRGLMAFNPRLHLPIQRLACCHKRLRPTRTCQIERRLALARGTHRRAPESTSSAPCAPSSWGQSATFSTSRCQRNSGSPCVLAAHRANTNKASLRRFTNLIFTGSTDSSRERCTHTRSARRHTVLA